MPWAAMPDGGGGGGPAALGGCCAGPLGGRGGIDEFVVAAGLLAVAADAPPTVGDMDRADDVDPVGEGVGRLGGGGGGGGAPDEGGGAKLSGGAGAGPSNGFCR